MTSEINLREVAEQMGDGSGAEVKGVCTEAGMYARRERRVHVTQEDFEMAVAKIMQKDAVIFKEGVILGADTRYRVLAAFL